MAAARSEARRQLHEALTVFLEILEEEAEALRRRNAEGLEQAIARKKTQTGLLAALTPECEFPADGAPSSDPVERAELDTLKALITRCAQANQTNGAAVAANREFTQSLLDILRGRPPGERLYEASGKVSRAQVYTHAREQV